MRKRNLSLLAVVVLAGCGGGSSSSSDPAQSPAGLSWQRGLFEAASVFKNKCEVVRTHLDIHGNYYPDEQGSALEEKLWLRSWSNETYLWYNEIIDVHPDFYSSPQSYFDALKTNQRTASGAYKDNFHFYEPTDEYESFSQSGAQTGYGINWAFLSSAPPRELRVSTVSDGSSANIEGVARGDRLIRINGEDVINGDDVDFLNNALFPDGEHSQFDFTFERSDGSEITVTLTSGVYEKSFVNNVSVLDAESGKVGYLRFDGFQRPAQTPLIESFQEFVDEDVSDLIIDLRYNGGGLLNMSSQLAYMIAGPDQTSDKVFETLEFNNRIPGVDPVTGAQITPTPFYTVEIDWDRRQFTDNTLPSLNLNRVFVIATENTCSASESLMNSLRGIDVEVIQIGGTTCGKPYGFYPTDNCGTTYYTIQFQGVNDKGFGDYSDGFKPSDSPSHDDELPGCEVDDDFSHPLGDTNEGMLLTALERLNTGSCPVRSEQMVTRRKTEKSLTDKQDALSVIDRRHRTMYLDNRIFVPLKDWVDE